MRSGDAPRVAVTFLFTDIVGSTELWEHEPARMGPAVRASEELQNHQIDAHNGRVFKNTGDGLAAAFDVPSDAVHAAGDIQLEVAGHGWTDGGLSLRIGVHTGEAELRSTDYFGSAVNLAARVMSVAKGGQVLVSEPTAAMARTALRGDYSLCDVGAAWLRGFEHSHRLAQLEHPDLPSDFPRLAPRAESGRPLPMPATNFVGRHDEVSDVMTALERGRLITLVGPPGVGKTRLALEVGRRIAERWSDGQAWCGLETATTPEQAFHTIAAALDVSELGNDPAADVVDHLAQREVLLIIDNCEHLLDAIREFTDTVMQRCPRTVVLATSQEAMRLPSEVAYVVEPLDVGSSGQSDQPAVRLFIDRARATGAEVDTSPDGRRAIGQLCARLDGIPLAIELAAARVRTMTMGEFGAALDRGFSLLASRDRGPSRSDRHRTLLRAVQWSYELLEEDERRLFELLGVFAGGADLDAVEVVAPRAGVILDDTRDVLWELVEKSIVQPDTHGKRTRYTMLSSLRAFALDRLTERGTLDQARTAHAEYFLSFAELAEHERAGPDERLWVEAQLREFDNLREAVAHASSIGDVDTALRIFVAMFETASMQGRVEVFDWVDPAALLETGHELLPAALAMSGLRHDPLRAASLETAESAIQLFEDGGGREHRILTFARGFAEASRQNRTESLRAFEETVDVVVTTEGRNGRWILARCLTAQYAPDLDSAGELLADARRVGQPSGIAFALLVMARALQSEQPEEALSMIEMAEELASTVYNRHVSVYVDLSRARALAQGPEPEAALAFLLRALESAVALRQHEAMWRSVGEIVVVLRRSGHSPQIDELLDPWLDRYPDGRDAAMQRFGVSTERVGTAYATPSFAELVTHSHNVLAEAMSVERAPIT